MSADTEVLRSTAARLTRLSSVRDTLRVMFCCESTRISVTGEHVDDPGNEAPSRD